MYRSNISLYNEDCLAFMDKCDAEQFDLILTDPPYLFNKSPGKPYSEREQCNTASKFSNSKLYSNDGFMMKEMSSFTEDDLVTFLDKTPRLMKVYNAYYFCSEAQVPFYCRWATDNNLMFSILVWEKPLSIINKNRYSQNVEFIVRIYDYGTALTRISDNRCYNRVKKYKPPTGRIHPTQKPVGLIEEILKVTTPSRVFDPFMGSGSVAVACDKNSIDMVGCELNEVHYREAQGWVNSQRGEQSLFPI